MTAPLVLLLALLGIGSLPAPRPRLVVVITVDQLRPDYLDRYRSQLTGGLALLLKQGAVFTEAYQDHAVTETAPGHSTILSGRWPAHTGIVRNTAGVQDSTAPLVGVTGLGASPARFRGTALSRSRGRTEGRSCRSAGPKSRSIGTPGATSPRAAITPTRSPSGCASSTAGAFLSRPPVRTGICSCPPGPTPSPTASRTRTAARISRSRTACRPTARAPRSSISPFRRWTR